MIRTLEHGWSYFYDLGRLGIVPQHSHHAGHEAQRQSENYPLPWHLHSTLPLATCTTPRYSGMLVSGMGWVKEGERGKVKGRSGGGRGLAGRRWSGSIRAGVLPAARRGQAWNANAKNGQAAKCQAVGQRLRLRLRALLAPLPMLRGLPASRPGLRCMHAVWACSSSPWPLKWLSHERDSGPDWCCCLRCRFALRAYAYNDTTYGVQ